ncbi:MAG TPA: trypsin-like serine protease [Actinoplanes sp.]|nr:trypsin-like serine protease [Actinoplanes sp.]
MRRRLALLAAAVVAVLALGSANPAGAITGNYKKDFGHDFVGLLVFYTTPDPETGDPFSHRCSGSLISPTVIVTAGHCTEGVDEGRVYFQQSVAPNYDPDAFGGLGGDPTTGYPYLNGITFHRADNYGFHDFDGYPENRDVGVVVLDRPYTPPSGQFGLLPAAGAIDDYLAAAGSKKNARFVTSGYGVSDQDPVPVSFRERLTAESYLVENSSTVTPYNLKTTANPSQDKGGSCSGDSGGPVFFKGTRTIAAVVSFGMNGQCKGLDFSYRLDRPEVLAWILDPNRVDAG